MSGIRNIGRKIAYYTVNLTNNRPLCFFSAIGGVRDIILGIGFVLGLDQIRQTRLFDNFDQLFPGYSGMIAGILFIVVGLFVAVMAAIDKSELTRYGLRFQSMAWLFCSWMYALEGDFILAAVFGIFFSVPAGYLAFYYKFAPIWADQKRRFREQWIKEHGLDSVLGP